MVVCAATALESSETSLPAGASAAEMREWADRMLRRKTDVAQTGVAAVPSQPFWDLNQLPDCPIESARCLLHRHNGACGCNTRGGC